MKEKMHIYYDTDGDYLEIRFGKPTPSYDEYVGNDVFERHDKKTGRISGYAFYNIKKKQVKSPRQIEIELPNISS